MSGALSSKGAPKEKRRTHREWVHGYDSHHVLPLHHFYKPHSKNHNTVSPFHISDRLNWFQKFISCTCTGYTSKPPLFNVVALLSVSIQMYLTKDVSFPSWFSLYTILLFPEQIISIFYSLNISQNRIDFIDGVHLYPGPVNARSKEDALFNICKLQLLHRTSQRIFLNNMSLSPFIKSHSITAITRHSFSAKLGISWQSAILDKWFANVFELNSSLQRSKSSLLNFQKLEQGKRAGLIPSNATHGLELPLSHWSHYIYDMFHHECDAPFERSEMIRIWSDEM